MATMSSLASTMPRWEHRTASSRPAAGSVGVEMVIFSRDWSDYTCSCTTWDPDGYMQHHCRSRQYTGVLASGNLSVVGCSTQEGLKLIIGLSIWVEGLEGGVCSQDKVRHHRGLATGWCGDGDSRGKHRISCNIELMQMINWERL